MAFHHCQLVNGKAVMSTGNPEAGALSLKAIRSQGVVLAVCMNITAL